MDTLKDFSQFAAHHMAVASVARLIVAAVLGCVIGLERELRHKAAGLRTNMFICMGAALFTVLSAAMAQVWGGDHTRIAAQIIPGIGFIGAGSILHSRGSVTGLTTAATVFVVASIGMAVGAGFYVLAVFATIVVLVGLLILGKLESRFHLKPLSIAYEVIGEDAEAVLSAVNKALEQQQHAMQNVQIGRTDHTYRVQFTVEAPESQQQTLLKMLRQAPALKNIQSLGSTERE
jgi:putative Mg2+ transporter-C (MgtC) family protein